MNAQASRERRGEARSLQTCVPCKGMWRLEKITERLPLKGDELLKTALSPSPPPSSLALSTALLIQWGAFVRKAPTRCAQGAWLRFSSASEGHRGARQLPQQQDRWRSSGRAGVGDESLQLPGPTTNPLRSKIQFVFIWYESIGRLLQNNIRCFKEAL